MRPDGDDCDLLIEGAHILTADAARREIPHGRIGTTGNRIAFIEAADARTAPMAGTVIDAAGCIVVPGFINTHTHAVLSLMRGIAEDMGFAPAYTKGVPHAPMITEEEAVALARLGALEALKFGSTAICDTYVHPLKTVPAMGALGLRIFGCNLLHDVDFAGMPEGRWDYDEAIGEARLAEVFALHENCHGGENGRLQVIMAPHAPDTCSTAFLKKVAEANERLGLRTAIHLAQSDIEVQRIAARDRRTPVELIDQVGLLNDRLLAAHCIKLTETDIKRAGDARIHVAHVPKGNAGGGMIAPTDRLRAAGANLTLSTDNLLADMTEGMRWALSIARLQTETVNSDWQPEHVFEMATINGARALGMTDEIGSLEPGNMADIVIVNVDAPHLTPRLDALGALVHCGQGSNVRDVIVDGEVVVRDGQAARADETAIMAEAQAAAEALWARARTR